METTFERTEDFKIKIKQGDCEVIVSQQAFLNFALSLPIETVSGVSVGNLSGTIRNVVDYVKIQEGQRNRIF